MEETPENTENKAETSKQPSQTEPTQSMPKEGEDNTIFIGIKPFMNYVTGVVMQFQNKGQKEVIVSARGKFISKAVDVVEVARKRFIEKQNIAIKHIKIDTKSYEKEGKKINVSTIDIALIR